MRALRAAGAVFLVLGFTVLLFVAYEFVGTSMIEHGHQRALAAAFDREQPVVFVAHRPLPERAPIARIRIPKLGIDQIVVEGTTIADLSNGPGHYRGTPMPWEQGATGIAGHRTGWGSPFVHLDRLRQNDVVVLETKHGRFTYKITGTMIVEPGDDWVLRGDPKSMAPQKLTLTTCTPKYTSLHRMIYWADMVKVT